MGYLVVAFVAGTVMAAWSVAAGHGLGAVLLAFWLGGATGAVVAAGLMAYRMYPRDRSPAEGRTAEG